MQYRILISLAVLLLAVPVTEAEERPLPPTWGALESSQNPEDLILVKRIGSLKWFDACAEWGRGVRAPKQSKRNGAIRLKLQYYGMLNAIDFEHVPKRSVAIGMNTCGVLASLGKPDVNNVTTTAASKTQQMVYRSRNIYIYSDGAAEIGNGIVNAIQQ